MKSMGYLYTLIAISLLYFIISVYYMAGLPKPIRAPLGDLDPNNLHKKNNHCKKT